MFQLKLHVHKQYYLAEEIIFIPQSAIDTDVLLFVFISLFSICMFATLGIHAFHVWVSVMIDSFKFVFLIVIKYFSKMLSDFTVVPIALVLLIILYIVMYFVSNVV